MKIIPLDLIEEAIKDIQEGKIIIVVDDEGRENEGDFLCAAELITDERVNFMVKHGRGLMCAPLTETRCEMLDLHMMTGKNTDPKKTAFTVSVDLIGQGVTTGVSSSDRAKTLRALTNEKTKAENLSRPGHIFPLKAREGGVLRRAGHTEAAIDFARLAGLYPAGVIVEIMNENGSMARLPQLREIADRFHLKLVSIEDLIAYRLSKDSLIEKIESFPIKTIFGDFTLTTFQQTDNQQIHFALTRGKWNKDETVPVRVKSSNRYYDIFASLTKGESNYLEQITKIIQGEGKGALVIVNNVSNPEDVLNRMNHYKLFQSGKCGAPTLAMDEKDYGIGAQIIKQLGIQKVKLISNTTKVLKGIEGYGIQIVDYIRF